MKDNKSMLIGKSRVNINEAWEVNEWTRKFGVTRERLAMAVKEVGNNASAVERFLKRGENSSAADLHYDGTPSISILYSAT